MKSGGNVSTHEPGHDRRQRAKITPAKGDLPIATKTRVQSAARAIDILHVVARDNGDGIPASEIAEILQLSRQTVYHLLHTLTETGMVRKANGARYLLGLGVASIADGFKRQLSNPDLFGNLARDAARMTGETAYVVGWVDGGIVVCASAPGELSINALEVPLGTGGNAHARASGKLLLAMRSDVEVAQYLAQHSLSRRTPNTITSIHRMNVELAKIRKSWCSTEREEYAVGVSCVAVPVGQIPARLVLGISAPTERFLQNEEEYVLKLRGVTSRVLARPTALRRLRDV